MTRIGEFMYNGNGKLLENGEVYTIYQTTDGVEAYAQNDPEPVEMNKGTFVSLQNGNLERVDGSTPMA